LPATGFQSGRDPDFHRRDLWEAIEAGDYPEFELGLQLIPEASSHTSDALPATGFQWKRTKVALPSALIRRKVWMGQSAHDTFWDYVSLQPETLHNVMWAMSDRGIPRSYRIPYQRRLAGDRFPVEANKGGFALGIDQAEGVDAPRDKALTIRSGTMFPCSRKRCTT
jgi:hypothetical protein